MTQEELVESMKLLHFFREGIDPYTGEVMDHPLFSETAFKTNLSLIEGELSSILARVSNHKKSPTKKERPPFFIMEAEIDSLCLPKKEMVISTFIREVNRVINIEERKGLTTYIFNRYLVSKGYLETLLDDKGDKYSAATTKGLENGMAMVKGTKDGRSYEKVVYNQEGMAFLKRMLIAYQEDHKEGLGPTN